MHLEITEEILKKYPTTAIGFLVANVTVKLTDPFVEDLKQGLKTQLQKMNILATNYAVHPNIAIWRKIYREDFRVSETQYRSSLESLVKRIVTGKGLWNICNIVDLYNCCSVMSLLPMGGYDLNKISGDITIRYAKEGEPFRGIGEKEQIQVLQRHVVYADHMRPICWLWNHKDAQATCIDEQTKKVLFFIDSAISNSSQAIHHALSFLEENLKKIGSIPFASGILDKNEPCTTFEIGG